MKRMMKKISAMFLMLILCTTTFTAYANLPVESDIRAEEPEAEEPDFVKTGLENVVHTEAELEQWIIDYKHTGGEVELGNNITITEMLTIYSVSAKITINTGQYGLIYDGGSIYTDNIEITGEGVEVPVVDVYDAGLFRSNWVHAIQNQYITATGRDGTGGIAVRISQDDNYLVNLDYLKTVGSIRSYGDGAVGLYLAVPLDVYGFSIGVEGKNSTAVYAIQGANLYYCRLTAGGNKASVIRGAGELVLDTCTSSPEPYNAKIINRHIIDIVGTRLYFPVKQDDDGFFYFQFAYTFLLSGGNGFPTTTSKFYVQWAENLYNIDTSILGQTVIYGSLDPLFQGLGLEDEFPLELVVEVRDPSIPCISDISFREDIGSEPYVNLRFWDAYDPNDENVILWRSDDGGATWYDFTHSPDINWYKYGDGLYYYGTITKAIMFKLEVLGAGESNIVILRSTDKAVTIGIGGDRDGGDRDVDSNPGNSNDNGSESNERGNVSQGGEAPTGGNSDSGNKFIETPEKPAGTSSAPQEWEDDHAIAISGKRLLALIEFNSETVTFIKQGIQVSISSNTLRTLGITNDQSFFVEIEVAGDSFSVTFTVDGNVIYELPFTAYIGEDVFDNVILELASFASEQDGVLPSSYDADTAKLSVNCPGSGVFTLVAFPATTSKDGDLISGADKSGTDISGDGISGEKVVQSDTSPLFSSANMIILLTICITLVFGATFIFTIRHLVKR